MNLTHEQIEGMRRFVQSYDAQNAAITREFDLNKPPTPPYKYQEYPRMLYRGTQTSIVHDDDECELMLSQNWSKTPSQAGTVNLNLGGDLTPAMRAEAQAIDARLREPSRNDMEREMEKLRAENAELKRQHPPDSTTFAPADTPEFIEGLSLKQRMTDLVRVRPMTPEAIAEQLEAPLPTIKKYAREESRFVVLDDGRVSLKAAG